MLPRSICFILPLVALAQDYRGNVKPVNTTRRPAEIEFGEFRFNALAFGHEGPGYVPIKTQPVAGREYLVEADIFAIDAVASVRFELVDENGRAVQTVVLWKETDSADSGQFVGLLTPPAYPFRCVAIGTDRNGTAFRHTFPRVFRPVARAPETLVIPPGMDDTYATAMHRMIDEYHQALNAKMDEARRIYPGGLVTLSRARVSSMSYEPLVSPNGNILGVRLHYVLQADVDLVVAAGPHVFPAYTSFDWRGTVSMKPLTGTVNPVPEVEGVASIADLILYNARARYRAGVSYTFTVDMVPDYVIHGVLSGGFCLNEARFVGLGRTRWDGIRASTAPVKYSLSIMDLDYAAEIPVFFPQRTFYEGLLNEGARDCGPQPTNRF